MDFEKIQLPTKPMYKNTKVLYLLAAVLLVAAGYWYFFYNKEEQTQQVQQVQLPGVVTPATTQAVTPTTQTVEPFIGQGCMACRL